MVVVAVSGYFDPIHVGHLELLKLARQLGDRLVVIVNNDQQVESVTVSKQGSGYTFGNVDIVAGGVPTGTTRPLFDVVISPPGGHRADI